MFSEPLISEFPVLSGLTGDTLVICYTPDSNMEPRVRHRHSTLEFSTNIYTRTFSRLLDWLKCLKSVQTYFILEHCAFSQKVSLCSVYLGVSTFYLLVHQKIETMWDIEDVIIPCILFRPLNNSRKFIEPFQAFGIWFGAQTHRILSFREYLIGNVRFCPKFHIETKSIYWIVPSSRLQKQARVERNNQYPLH